MLGLVPNGLRLVNDHRSPAPGSALRRILLGGANLAFLAFVVPNKRSAACLALFIVGTYAALWLLRKRPSRFLVVASIVLVVSVFLFLKRYTFLELMLPERAWYSVPVVIGISYMLFRFIHMVIDQWQGQLAPFDFASYASYQLLFFTLVAGPIQRYNDFDHYWRSGDPPNGDEAQTLACWNRLLTGMIKVGLLAPIAWALFEESRTYLLGAAHDQVLLRFALFFYGYPVFLYLNFSGYTDIVVAAARLIGLTLPENFNRPYLARNIIDFWNRWHISLTHWIRDYVFMTLYKLGVESFPRASKLLGYGLLFFALLLAGIWHGSTADFAVFGAIHGLGAATNQIYGDSLRSWLGRERFRAYNRSRLIHWLAILTTIHYVCFAFMFFSSGIGGTFDVLRGETLPRFVGRDAFGAEPRRLSAPDAHPPDSLGHMETRGVAGVFRSFGGAPVGEDRVALRACHHQTCTNCLHAHFSLGFGEGARDRVHEVLDLNQA